MDKPIMIETPTVEVPVDIQIPVPTENRPTLADMPVRIEMNI